MSFAAGAFTSGIRGGQDGHAHRRQQSSSAMLNKSTVATSSNVTGGTNATIQASSSGQGWSGGVSAPPSSAMAALIGSKRPTMLELPVRIVSDPGHKSLIDAAQQDAKG